MTIAVDMGCKATKQTKPEVIQCTGVVIDRQPHPSHICKISLLLAPLAVHVQAGYSAFPFYTLTKLLI